MASSELLLAHDRMSSAWLTPARLKWATTLWHFCIKDASILGIYHGLEVPEPSSETMMAVIC